MKVYLKEYIDESAVEKLKEHAEVVSDFSDIENIDAIITRGEDINRSIISRAKNLKVIGKHGVGLDSIDLDAAKEFNKRVVFTPGCNSNSVAELSIALLMDVCRNVTLAYNAVKAGIEMDIAPKEFTGIELSGKTMGYIGLGMVTMKSCRILRDGFNMEILGYDPYVSYEDCRKNGISKIETVDEVLSKADFVHISVPLNDETRGLIGSKEIAKMKATAILVNTARGGIVDERALYEALKNHQILGAAADVFDEEPVSLNNPLLQLENFVGTPHLGACTKEAMVRMGNTVVEEVLAVLEGKEPRFSVVQ